MDALVKAKTGTGKSVAFLVHPISFMFNTLHCVLNFFFLSMMLSANSFLQLKQF